MGSRPVAYPKPFADAPARMQELGLFDDIGKQKYAVVQAKVHTNT
jgi:hypothetical protein